MKQIKQRQNRINQHEMILYPIQIYIIIIEIMVEIIIVIIIKMTKIIYPKKKEKNYWLKSKMNGK